DGEDSPSEPVGNFQLEQDRAENPENGAAKVREQYGYGGEPQRRRPGEHQVEDANHEIRGPDRPAQRLRLLSENPSKHDRSECGTDPARTVEDADSRRRASAHRKDTLPEDRQQ